MYFYCSYGGKFSVVTQNVAFAHAKHGQNNEKKRPFFDKKETKKGPKKRTKKKFKREKKTKNGPKKDDFETKNIILRQKKTKKHIDTEKNNLK